MDGVCTACGSHFRAQLIHCAFDASSYAYCARCGTTAFCSHATWPAGVPRSKAGPLDPEQSRFLRRCACGGYFHTHGMPRCPSCHTALDPIEAGAWIQAQTVRTSRTWSWQNSWVGQYAIVVAQAIDRDPWAGPAR